MDMFQLPKKKREIIGNQKWYKGSAIRRTKEVIGMCIMLDAGLSKKEIKKLYLENFPGDSDDEPEGNICARISGRKTIARDVLGWMDDHKIKIIRIE